MSESKETMCFLIRTDSDALTGLERITYEAFQVYPAVNSVFPAFEVADLHTSVMGSAGPTPYRQLESHRPQVYCI